MRDADRLINGLAQRADRVLELQTALTAFAPVGPDSGGHGEWDSAEWLQKRLREFGLTNLERVDADDSRVPSGKRPNLIARIPGKTPRTLWILAHLDVVPPGDLSMWASDPWTVVRDAADPDIIYGRGVEDNQQAVVSGILLAAELLQQNITPDVGLGLIFVADEETGNKYGAIHVMEQRPNLVDPNDLVLVPDFGTADGTLVEVAEKGSLWLKVTVTGVQCHASTPDEGRNSLVAAADMIMHVADVAATFDAEDTLFVPPRSTMVPTRHDSNVPNVNTIPGKDVFFIDCRVLSVYHVDDVHQAFRKLADEVAARHGVSISVEAVSREPAFPATSPESEVVVRLMDSIKKTYSIDCHPGGVGGGTVAKMFRERNIPAAVWSRVFNRCHVPNEAARLSWAIGDAQVFGRLLFNE